MSYSWFVILSCSIFIPAFIAVFRFHKIDSLCRPFIFCTWVGSLNELISIAAPHLGYSTSLNNNSYVLFESLLLLWQFWNWNALGRKRSFYRVALLLLPAIWFFENFVVFSIHQTEPWFRLFYSFLTVLLAINVINTLIIAEQNVLYQHPVFILCMGVVVFYIYKLIVEACWVSQLYATPGFMLNIYVILIWINLIVNIIYAIALLWMPGKLPFSLPY
jgi:hypothetical protein